MQLHFLGTAGFHPNRRRDTACLMLPEAGVILDAGTGLFRARDLIATRTLDIFLTHAHLDHSCGLTYLLDVVCDRAIDEVRVHAAPSIHSAIADHLFAPALFPVQPGFRLVELDGRPVDLAGGGKLRTFEVPHPGGCLGFRLDWPGRSMAYVTDTTASATACYREPIRGVDLLVHECNFPDSMHERAELTGHSCLTPVARLAAEAGAKKTWLVHLNPLDENDELLDLESARSICPGIALAEDGMMVEF